MPRADWLSGASVVPTRSSPMHLLGATTRLIRFAGRATEWATMQSQQCCSEGSEPKCRCVDSARHAVANTTMQSQTIHALCLRISGLSRQSRIRSGGSGHVIWSRNESCCSVQLRSKFRSRNPEEKTITYRRGPGMFLEYVTYDSPKRKVAKKSSPHSRPSGSCRTRPRGPERLFGDSPRDLSRARSDEQLDV